MKEHQQEYVISLQGFQFCLQAWNVPNFYYLFTTIDMETNITQWGYVYSA